MGDDGDRWSADASAIGARTLIGIGSMLVGCTVAGMLLGWIADEALGSSPVGIIVGLSLGVALGVVGSCLRVAKVLRS